MDDLDVRAVGPIEEITPPGEGVSHLGEGADDVGRRADQAAGDFGAVVDEPGVLDGVGADAAAGPIRRGRRSRQGGWRGAMAEMVWRERGAGGGDRGASSRMPTRRLARGPMR